MSLLLNLISIPNAKLSHVIVYLFEGLSSVSHLQLVSVNITADFLKENLYFVD